MATGEACAHIQGLGTNPAPKSEPLDTSTQSADASTSNSGRAPGIRPQVWAIRWGRQSREPPLNGHRRGARSHLAQKSLLALATPPGGGSPNLVRNRQTGRERPGGLTLGKNARRRGRVVGD
ncbi:UNVERIFIED_CONTAM: hypothetical protein FKN15_067182 [Acipenser sinensis]